MNCCYTDEKRDHCNSRRMADLPMCQFHMMRTFRDALVAGALPRDVFKEIAQEAVTTMLGGQRRRDDRTQLAVLEAKRLRQLQEREEAARREAQSVVYYVQLTGDRIKIGWTSDLATRMAVYRARPEDVLATEPGGRTLEAKRHRQFAAERIGRSEDFNMSDSIRRHIARLNGQDA